MNYRSVVNKRALEIPNVSIDETFLRTLEKQLSSLGGDKLANGKYCNSCVLKSVVLFYCMAPCLVLLYLCMCVYGEAPPRHKTLLIIKHGTSDIRKM